MDDFNALAARMAGVVDDVRGCLIVSRDAMVLGAYPEDAETALKPAWLRFCALGDAERGFVHIGAELWSFARRGRHAAFVVTGAATRPGLVLDHIDQALALADEARSDRGGLKLPEAATPARTTPTTEPRPAGDPSAARSPSIIAGRLSERAGTTSPGSPPPERRDTEPGKPSPEAVTPSPQPAPARSSVWATREGEPGEDVDRAELAREFSGLLQQGERPADG
jgi:hypothetical protein